MSKNYTYTADEELAEIRERRHNEMVRMEQWKDDLILLGSLMGVCLIWILIVVLGVIK